MKKKTNSFLLLSIVAICLLYFSYAIFCGIGTFADVLRGMEIIHQSKLGGQWNTLAFPSVYGPFSFFVAWWSPAQWVFLAFLSEFITTNVQVTQLILVGVCIPLGLYGYYILSLKLNFSKRTALLSLLLIVSNQLFYWNFILFYGGDLFVFAFLPYYLLLLIYLVEKQVVKHTIIFLIASVFFCFLKNTAVVFVAASMPFLFVSLPKSNARNKIHVASILLLITGILALLFFSFFRQGETPGQSNEWIGYNGIENTYLSDICYSLAAPLGVLTHLGSAVQKSSPYLNNVYESVTVAQLCLLLLSFVFFMFIYKKLRHSHTWVFLLTYTFILPVLLVFLYFYWFNRAVSYDSRHFAALSFVLAPAFITFISELKRFKKVALSLLIGISVIDLAQFFVERQQFAQTQQLVQGVYVKNEEARLLRTISTWANSHPNGLIVINDKWIGVLGCQSNDKIVLRSSQKNKWIVVSGMELDNPPMVGLNQVLDTTHYSAILVVDNDKEPRIVSHLQRLSWQKIAKTSNFSYYEWTK